MTPDEAWAAASEDAAADEPLTEAEAEAIVRRAGRQAAGALRTAAENDSTKTSGSDAA